jgi:hypothetical protein
MDFISLKIASTISLKSGNYQLPPNLNNNLITILFAIIHK